MIPGEIQDKDVLFLRIAALGFNVSVSTQLLQLRLIL